IRIEIDALGRQRSNSLGRLTGNLSMSFLFGNTKSPPRAPTTAPGVQDVTSNGDANEFYRELTDRRPALLDERLKLHARIVDEFNLVMLDKMPKDELMKHVRAYIADYVQAEKISLNQKELNLFTEEVINEMTGFGPIEPL